MIVEDKEASVTKADQIAQKLITLMTQEAKHYECEDDPAEHAYLAVHSVGNLISRISLLLENYAQIYGIPNMTAETIYSWIDIVAKEYLAINKIEEK